MRELLQSVGDAAQMRLRYSSFFLHLMGGKIDRRIDYPAELDLGPSTSSRERSVYRLFAVLVHAGRSVNSGHYFCFTKSPAGVWLECDDASVHHASERTVLSQKAYMLFYVRESAGAEGGDPPLPAGAGAAAQKAGALRRGAVSLPGPSSSPPHQRLLRGERGAPEAGRGPLPAVRPPPAARPTCELPSRVAQGAPADRHAQPVQAAGR